MRPFLGRVPLRASRSRSLGQVEFTDPWGGVHRITVEPEPAPPQFQPFNAPFSEESRLRDQREETYRRKIAAKREECEFLRQNSEDHFSHFEELGTSDDEAYQLYSHAYDQYSDCVDQVNALIDEMDTAPVDFGINPPDTYKWPAEVPEPTGRPFVPEEPYIHHPEDYPPVASTDYEWPVEVPKPGEWPPEEPPEIIEQPPPPVTPPIPPPVSSVDDWKTSGCAPGTQRIVRGGMCVSSSLVSTALTTPTMTTPFTMGRAMLGQVRLVRRPGAF